MQFDKEGVLFALQGKGHDRLDVDEIDAEAVKVVQTQTENEIYQGVTDSLPPSVIDYLLKVDQMARNQLPRADIQYLPPPPNIRERRRIGKTVMGSIRRVIWRSLCDPESDVYKLWNTGLIETVLDRKLITASIAVTMSGMNLGYKLLAVSAAGLVIKMGVEVFCDRYMPEGIMAARTRR